MGNLGRTVETFAWLTVTLVISLSASLTGALHGYRSHILALAVMCIAYGTRQFLGHGGPRVTALGTFNYGCALFVGLASIDAVNAHTLRGMHTQLFVALVASFLAQVVITHLARQSRAGDTHVPWWAPEPSACRWLMGWGVTGLAVAALAKAMTPAPALLLEGAAFTASLAVAAAAVLAPRGRLTFAGVTATVAALVLYGELFHGGGGRLRLVALLAAVGLLLTARFTTRWLKAAAVTFTPVALYALAQYRLAYQESLNVGASQGNTGLESMMTPMHVFPQMLRAQETGDIGYAWGSSLLTLPRTFLPDSWIPDFVPQALGYELVAVTDPSRMGSGFSTVSSVFGEAWWNAGWFGVALAMPVLALLLIVLDRLLVRYLRGASIARSRTDLVWLVLVLALCASSLDLVWSGTHTWLARMEARLPLLVVLFLSAAHHDARAAQSATATRPQRAVSTRAG